MQRGMLYSIYWVFFVCVLMYSEYLITNQTNVQVKFIKNIIKRNVCFLHFR